MAVLIGYSLVHKINRLRTIYLLLVSLFFYFKTSGVFVLLLLFTICSDFYWGQRIHASRSPTQRRLFLTISVLLNLSLLCYFKYAWFFTESFNQIAGTHFSYFNHFAAFSNHYLSTHFNLDQLILPVGVSFFTFQSLSYTIDMYRRRIEPVRNVLDYGFFVCFFPHLVAGPIVKAHEFVHQIYQPYRLKRAEFGIALFWILNGFSKKIVADYIAVNYVDRIFDSPHLFSGLETLIGIFGYSLQIYMDFSGYTDMAIGLALILGYRLKANFNSPYKAESVSEFWQRWHISLSSWLKEYLYFPLGGNRHGTAGSYVAITVIALFLVLLSGKLWLIAVLLLCAALLLIGAYFSTRFRSGLNTNINLMVTMLLGGLWHGSSWLFLIWGGLNGLGLVVHKAWARISPFSNSTHRVLRFTLVLITLTFISFTRIFFRSDSMQTVSTIFERMSDHFGANLWADVLLGYRAVFGLLLLGYLLHWVPEPVKVRYRNWFATRSYVVMLALSLLVVFVMYQLMSGEMQPFIYFQF